MNSSKIFGLVLWVSTFALCAPGQWTWQNPLPQGNDLRAVQFLNADTGFIAGDGGSFLKTEDGGATWSLSRVPTGSLIFSMAFKDAQTGVVVTNGSNNDSVPKYGLYRTEDGGKSWRETMAMEANAGTIVQWPGGNTVYVTNDSTIKVSRNGGLDWSPCVSFGYNSGHILSSFWDADRGYFFGPGDSSKSGRKLYRTYDGCAHFDSRSLPDSTGYNFIHFRDARNGIVMGERTSGEILLRTQDSGNTWIEVKPLGDQMWNFQSIQYTDSMTAFGFGGDGSVQKTRDGGATWTPVGVGNGSLVLWGAAFPTERVAYRVGNSGLIEKSLDGSATWQEITHIDLGRFGSQLKDLDFVDAQIGCGAGSILRRNPQREEAIILRTIDGGNHWDTLPQSALPLHSIRFRDASLGLAVGDSGTLLRTTDRGATWVQSNRITTENLISIRFGDNQDVFACAERNSIYRSQDDGKTWHKVYADTGTHFYSMDFRGSGFGIAGGYTGQKAVILRTTDGGNNWRAFPIGRPEKPDTEFPNAVHIGPTGIAYAVDDYDVLYRSTDTGKTWDSLAYLGQTSARSILFLGRDTGFIAGLRAIRMTVDGGMTWVLEQTLTNGLPELEALSFPKGGNGYAIGIFGDILRYDRGTSGIQKLVNASPLPKLILEDGRLRYYLNSRTTISAALFRLDGMVVSRLQGGVQEPGEHSIPLPVLAGVGPLVLEFDFGNLKHTELLTRKR